MAQIAVAFTDNVMRIRSQACCCEFPEVDKNRKAVWVFLRSLCSPETGKPLFTYQQLAEAFGDDARQHVANFVAEFRARQQNFVPFLTRVNTTQGRLHAIDVHPLAVEATARKIQELKLNHVYVTCADAHATGFADGLFDVILLYGVIPAPGIIDIDRLTREMSRLLKPEGRLAVWTAVPLWSPTSLTKDHLLMYLGKHDGVHQFQK